MRRSRSHRALSLRRQQLGAASRRGMSLVEIVVALTILTGAMLGLGAFGVRFTRTMTQTRIVSTALDLATDRIEDVKLSQTYAGIDALAGTETAPNGMTGYKRTTIVTRVGGVANSVVDYRIVTIDVRGPASTPSVRKTTIIASY
jgi:prepilin-type N-terminal cleavage/methylation domain-containing protein